MAPSILAGSVQADARIEDLSDKLHYDAMQELPWGESGLYLSNTALNEQERAQLQEIFQRNGVSDLVWKGFQRYYRTEVLKESIRPL